MFGSKGMLGMRGRRRRSSVDGDGEGDEVEESWKMMEGPMDEEDVKTEGGAV